MSFQISITVSIRSSQTLIGITATTFDVSQISWNIDGINPIKIDLFTNGILLYFFTNKISQFNLELGTYQGDYSNSNLLTYLANQNSFFGNFVPPDGTTVPIILGTIGSIAIIGGAILLAKTRG